MQDLQLLAGDMSALWRRPCDERGQQREISDVYTLSPIPTTKGLLGASFPGFIPLKGALR
jgi:hypothetical protein